MSSNQSSPAVPDDTEARILDTAGRVFAEAGFHNAKVRDICARAGVNLAAINYHFGDKLGLYREVLQRAAGAGVDPSLFDPSLPGPSPQARLFGFVRGLLEHMYGEDRPAWPVRLMTHELAQPSPALDGVVEQMFRPRYEAARALVSSIIRLPRDDRRTRLCTQSIIGQVTVYAHGREALKRLWPDLKFTPETLDEIAAHIAAFSYAALRSMARHAAAKQTERKQPGGRRRRTQS